MYVTTQGNTIDTELCDFVLVKDSSWIGRWDGKAVRGRPVGVGARNEGKLIDNEAYIMFTSSVCRCYGFKFTLMQNHNGVRRQC